MFSAVCRTDFSTVTVRVLAGHHTPDGIIVEDITHD